ncbi:MAG TPA: hypothetical protein VMO26_25310 [Vicinamibacterales bacterium]|nr:hypothetical protein [Vicinamibacterales bacterium]
MSHHVIRSSARRAGSPRVRRFNAVQIHFPAAGDLITFNAVAARIGLVSDLTGARKTVVKFNSGMSKRSRLLRRR